MGFVAAFITKSFDETDWFESTGKASLRSNCRFSAEAVLLCLRGMMEEAILDCPQSGLSGSLAAGSACACFLGVSKGGVHSL